MLRIGSFSLFERVLKHGMNSSQLQLVMTAIGKSRAYFHALRGLKDGVHLTLHPLEKGGCLEQTPKCLKPLRKNVCDD